MSTWLDRVPPPWAPIHPVFTVSSKTVDVRPRFLFQNGEAAYFLGRLALWNWETVMGCLLCQQAVELVVKALIREDGQQPPHSHDLVAMLQKHQTAFPYFGVLLREPDKYHLLSQLSGAYNLQRYGECGGQTRPLDLMQLIDEIIFSLRQEYLNKVNAQNYRSLVHPALIEFVLTNNLFYLPGHLTSDPGDFANHTLPW